MNIPDIKAQAALEFIATYGWGLLAIVIGVAIVYSLGLFSTTTFINNQCTFTSNFGCLKAFLYTNGTLYINIEQSSPDPINITAVGCDTTGIPTNMTQLSNAVYLPIGASASFSTICYQNGTLSKSASGTPYKGYVLINYTNQDTGFRHLEVGTLIQKSIPTFSLAPTTTLTIHTTTTSTSTSSTTSTIVTTTSVGTTTTTGTSTSTSTTSTSTSTTSTSTSTTSTSASTTSTIHYVPIILTNSQSSATNAPLQVMFVVNSALYSSYINSQWNNVEFTTGPAATGTVLQAWIENSPSNGAASTIVWVNIPYSIAANGGTNTINMDLMGSNVMSAAGPTGEAPQLSGNYGQYDNGALVFTNYWNFAGSALPANLQGANFIGGSGGSYVQNNGIVIKSNLGGYAILDALSMTSPYVLDTYGSIAGAGGSYGYRPAMIISAGNAINNPNVIALDQGGFGSNMFCLYSYSGGYSNIGLFGGIVPAGNFQISAMVGGNNYYIGATPAGTATVYTYNPYSTPNKGNYVGIGSEITGNGITYYWFRTRTFPPNTIMPSVSFGSVV
ncbi:MAG: hypothetical protein ACHQX1_01265 [Candidatus Micrarchaeales archaeon]